MWVSWNPLHQRSHSLTLQVQHWVRCSLTRGRAHIDRGRGGEREAAVFHSSREKLHTLPPLLRVSPDFSSHAGILTLLLLAPPACLPVSAAADDINRASLPSSLHTVGASRRRTEERRGAGPPSDLLHHKPPNCVI